jgi:hypothetical protein
VPTEDRCVPEPADACQPSVERDRPLTRRLALSGLAALAGGAVATAVAGSAFAQSASTTTTGSETSGSGAGSSGSAAPSTEPAPTTTAPPKRPTSADIVLLGFAQSLEFAASQLYGQATPTLSPDWQPIGAVFGRHHRSYGEQIGALLGRRAPGVANQTLLNERTPAFGARTEPAILKAAYELEISLAASYTQLLGLLKGTDGITLVASFQPVEARQAVVLGQATDVSDEDLMPVVEGDEPGATLFTPSQYPII